MRILAGGYAVFGHPGPAILGVALDTTQAGLSSNALPTPPIAYLVSKKAMAGVSVIIVVVITGLETSAGGVRLPPLAEFVRALVVALGALKREYGNAPGQSLPSVPQLHWRSHSAATAVANRNAGS